MAQLVPLPLTVSCSSKIQIGFTFLVPSHPGSPGQRAVKRGVVLRHPHPVKLCVCVIGAGVKLRGRERGQALPAKTK